MKVEVLTVHPSRDGVVLVEEYWDCECKDDGCSPKSIHRKADQKRCSACGARKNEQPDSRLNEVVAAYAHRFDEFRVVCGWGDT